MKKKKNGNIYDSDMIEELFECYVVIFSLTKGKRQTQSFVITIGKIELILKQYEVIAFI